MTHGARMHMRHPQLLLQLVIAFGCDSVSSATVTTPSLFLPPLVQRFRPPKQTAAQAAAQGRIAAKATTQSAAARAWAVGYLGGPAVRPFLDSSLQHFSGEELLEMFEWEFKRLPLFHNAPTDGKDGHAAPDDSAGAGAWGSRGVRNRARLCAQPRRMSADLQ